MRIFATCLVKNERDIIKATVTAAACWCDVLYVHDTGSTDDTWDAILNLASVYDQVVPFRCEDVKFDRNLRSETFERFRSEGRSDDWWGILDADEIYIDDPRSFLATVPAGRGVVWSSCYEFMFTEHDLEQYRRDPSPYANDAGVEDRLRYYANSWSEPRFFRYRPDQIWDDQRKHPAPRGRSHLIRIRYKHYQYRSPDQIQKRLDTRIEALESGQFAHERREYWARYSDRAAELLRQGYIGPQTWEERVVNSSMLHRDLRDGHFVADEAALPPIED